MNAELKAKWVAALRSGEYKQTTGQLKYMGTSAESTKFCCLGVLCEVAGVPWSDDHDMYAFEVDDYYEPRLNDAELEGPLADAVGDQAVLSRMNDGYEDEPPKPFAYIADWIDANIPAEGAS